MSEWVTGVVESVGYVGIALLMVLEMWIPVVQSEIVMTFSGFAARTGELSLVGAITAGVVGTQVGGLTLYAASRLVPEERVRHVLARYGSWLGLTDQGLRELEDRFRDNEVKTVVLGRLLPGVRGVIAVPAGILGMNVWLFLACSAVGGVLWTAALAVLGYLLGTQYQRVDEYSSYVSVVLAALVVALVVWRVVKVRRARRAT